jgi:hypothetical protein
MDSTVKCFRPVSTIAFGGVLLLAALSPAVLRGRQPFPGVDYPPWQFAVSGDSRNCGDVVMPAIAAGVLSHKAEFYWHLGDFRKIYDFDEDMQQQPENRAKPLTIIDYEKRAWDDFLENQITPFGALPVFLGIGNHETIPPKTREEFVAQFANWINSPTLVEQRLRDNPRDFRARTYSHWLHNGVDFINLDNATPEQFDAAQMKWLEGVLAQDRNNSGISAVVVGMHEALPESISAGHSMNQSPTGIESGRKVYAELLALQNEAHKHVYVLASHSHFFMDGIFNTEYWRTHGGVLPGWIVGTAGAVRYALPENAKDARTAMTNVYGHLAGTVGPGGVIHFEFHPIKETDIPAAVTARYTAEFVHTCFAENSAK